MSQNAVTQPTGDWALFLDVDGTLLEIAETPQGVHVPTNIKQLLTRLSLHLNGALALVSGRNLHEVDRLFEPLRLCAAGVHGYERREPSGRVIMPSLDAGRLSAARAELAAFVQCHAGLLLEDKGCGLAIHFRRAPHLSGEAHAAVKSVCQRLGPEFVLQAGKCVFEIRPAAWTKGVAITAFMSQPPFVNRTPIFLGDDLTDEDGFAAVNGLGGISIKVGDAPTTLARYRLAGVREVVRWLSNLPEPTFASFPP